MPVAIPLAIAGAEAIGSSSIGLAAIGGAEAAAGFGTAAYGTLEAADVAAEVGMTGLQELSLGASLFSAGGQLLSGMAAEKSAKYNAGIAANNAKIERQNAISTMQEGEANAAAASQASKAKIGGILAQQGASGVDVGSGSAIDTRASEAEVGQLNAINIRAQAARSAYGHETSAASATAEQGMYKSEAAMAPIESSISASGTLLSNATNPITSPYAKYLSDRSLGSSDY